jgi:hypothetical protein
MNLAKTRERLIGAILLGNNVAITTALPVPRQSS